MSVLVLIDFLVKPEKISDVKALLAQALPDTRAYEGCLWVDVYANADDPSNMVFVEAWDSRSHHEKYAAWRHETGFGETFGPMLLGPPTKRFFEKVDV
jgi:quinol monooxygenase YgiN